MTQDLISLLDRSLADVEEAAIRASFSRHNGNRRRMMRELRTSKSNLLRKLSKFGLRAIPRPRHLQERDLALAFRRHRAEMTRELRISDATQIRWLNSKAPFAVEE